MAVRAFTEDGSCVAFLLCFPRHDGVETALTWMDELAGFPDQLDVGIPILRLR